MKTTAVALIVYSTAASAFSPPLAVQTQISKSLCIEAAAATDPRSDDGDGGRDNDNTLVIPITYNEMIQQASQCISDAYNHGKSRQIVRIFLPRTTEYQTRPFGERVEIDVDSLDDRARNNEDEVRLVPPDESWQGGIMQLYRTTAPAAKDVLRRLSNTFWGNAGVPPRIVEDRSIDESGVDGVGLCYTQLLGGSSARSDATENVGEDARGGFFGGDVVALPTLSEKDNCIFIQPNQEVAESIDKLSAQSPPESLIVLLNPQWRDVDDALDSASKTDGIFGTLASLLGGNKGSVMRRLKDDLGYVSTYTLEGYVCKGGNVRLIKRFDSDWVVFAEKDKERGDFASSYVKLGSTVERPSYQDVETMMDEKGIENKYARDLGMAPKL